MDELSVAFDDGKRKRGGEEMKECHCQGGWMCPECVEVLRHSEMARLRREKEIEENVRADEREKCAKIAEGFAQDRDWVPGSLYANIRAEVAAEIRNKELKNGET